MGKRASRTSAFGRLLAPALVAALLALTGAFTACGGSTSVGNRQLIGRQLTVLADWKGQEQQRFSAVLRGFEERTGARVDYIAAADGVPQKLAALIRWRHPPDVAFLPQPGLLRDYAARDALMPLDAQTAADVARNYSPVWQSLGSFGGRLYGIWFKAADKSLIWYNIGAFEHAGVVPPETLDGLMRVAAALARDGVAPFSVGARDGWTLTDLFENLYLRTAGVARYDALTAHRLSWTDPSVVATLRLFQRLLRPQYVADGPQAAVHTDFDAAVARITGNPPKAAMTIEADFVAGALSGPFAELGTDVDAFAFPAVKPPQPVVIAGGDVAVQFDRSAATQAFMRYLATPEAAGLWASQGGFLSPNEALDLTAYPDPLSRSFARSLLEAGDGLRFDLSDQQPAAFGSNEQAGLFLALRAVLRGADVTKVARQLEADAQRASSEGGG